MSILDSTKNQNTTLEYEIKQFAEDSLKLSVDKKKAFLYGNARIEYQNITISASYIEIDYYLPTLHF